MDTNLVVGGTASVVSTSTLNGKSTHAAGLDTGNGYDGANTGTGVTVTHQGVINLKGNLVGGGDMAITGASTLTGTVKVAGGYVATTGTGVTLTNQGAISMNQNLKV